MSTNQRNTNEFFQNPGNNRPPPPPPPRPGSSTTGSSYYSSLPPNTSNPPPPPPPRQTAPRSYPPAPAPAPKQEEWFDDQPPPPAPAPSSDWYSTNTQTYETTSTPQQQQQAPMPQPQTFHPAAASSNLSGPMQSSNQATYTASSSSSSGYNPYNPSEYDDEPPLLEELGINVHHIIAKSRAVIFPISRKTKEDEHLMDDTDLAGPLLFGLLLGGELLLSAKIHFGYIYGFGMFAWLAMSLILNLLSPPDKPISVWTVMSILGYSLLPVNILALFNIFINLKKLQFGFGLTLTSMVVLWCTTSSTRLFEKLGLRDQRYLIAYPAMLVYSAFVILTIF